jgi:hypothetical protein
VNSKKERRGKREKESYDAGEGSGGDREEVYMHDENLERPVVCTTSDHLSMVQPRRIQADLEWLDWAAG